MGYLHFFSTLTDTLAAIAINGGYASLFLVMVLEGVPIIGIIVPGHVAILGAGFLVAAGVFNVYIVIIVATVGAVAGDYLSFVLGRRFGWSFIDRVRRFLFIKDAHIEKAKKLLGTHTGKALIVGRMNPVTRGIMPFLVGANHTPVGSFWVFNVIGATLWVVASVIIGYGVGLGTHLAAGFLGRAVVVAILCGILIIWGYRFVNLRFHIFRRYELFALGLNLVSLYILSRTISDAISNAPFLAGFDEWVNSFMLCLSGTFPAAMNTLCVAYPTAPSLVPVAAWVSAIGSPTVLSYIAVAICLLLAYRKRWRSSVIMLLSVGSANFAAGWMKDFFDIGRPHDMILPFSNLGNWLFDSASLASNPSFPSGHAAFAAAFFVILGYLVAPKIHSWWVWRELFIVACVLVPIAIGLSRVILDVHWASDVIAGWALGVFCATASILLVRYVGALFVEKVSN